MTDERGGGERPRRIEWGTSDARDYFLSKTREHLDPEIDMFRSYQQALRDMAEMLGEQLGPEEEEITDERAAAELPLYPYEDDALVRDEEGAHIGRRLMLTRVNVEDGHKNFMAAVPVAEVLDNGQILELNPAFNPDQINLLATQLAEQKRYGLDRPAS